MDIEEPLFQPFPSDIVFQNFNPFETYQVPLQLRNNDKVLYVNFRFICLWLICVISLCIKFSVLQNAYRYSSQKRSLQNHLELNVEQ